MGHERSDFATSPDEPTVCLTQGQVDLGRRDNIPKIERGWERLFYYGVVLIPGKNNH